MRKDETQQAAFYIETDPLEWPVTVRMPVSGGKFADFRFTGMFARLSGEEIDALTGAEEFQKELAEASAASDLERLKQLHLDMRSRAAMQLPQILLGWNGVKTRPGGADVPFTAEILQAQLKGPNGEALERGIWNAVGEIRNGYRLGNSETLPVTGQHSEPGAEEPTL